MKNVTMTSQIIQITASALRGGIVENRHEATVVVTDTTTPHPEKFPTPGVSMGVFLRSGAKPFQALPLLHHPQSQSLDLRTWAIVCASHSASKPHLELVKQLLQRADCTESDLQCGPHEPIDAEMAKALLCHQQAPTKIHNNCSGKHAGMLLACRYYGWPIETYLELNHPLQQAIRHAVENYSGESNIQTAMDGCGAPVFYLSVEGAARLFGQLAIHPKLQTLRQAMISYPELVGDPKRIDTCLMTISQGQLVAKVGAEGFLGVGNIQTGEGLVIKVHDGDNAVRDKMVIAVLEKLGWLTPSQAEALQAKPAFSQARYNTQGRAVGAYCFTW